jgi:hypothetical protein
MRPIVTLMHHSLLSTQRPGPHPSLTGEGDRRGSNPRPSLEPQSDVGRYVDHPPMLRRLTVLAATAVAVLAALKAVAGFDLLEVPPPSYRLPVDIPPSSQ